MEQLVGEFKYDPETGVITRLKRHGNYKEGTKCESVTTCGRYLKLTFRGRTYLQHRVAWYLHTGQEPPVQIDHKDLNGLNNAWSNLRESCPSTNQMNIRPHARSITGIKGIMPIRGGTLYRAEVCVQGKRYQKHSKTIGPLIEWLEIKRAELHGDFNRSF